LKVSAHWWRWLIVSGVIVLIDLMTKAFIESNLRLGDSITVTSWFNIVRAHNPGAAFSFLANAGGWQRYFFITLTVIVSVGLVVFMRKHHRNSLFAVSMASVLGGAIGNLHDRIVHGFVIDFVQWHYAGWAWPAFNVADSAICFGVALMLVDSFRPEANPDSEPPKP
jgi:signal peptidase II